MRRLILISLTALALTACATAATEAPPLPTTAPTLPGDTPPPATQPPTDSPQAETPTPEISQQVDAQPTEAQPDSQSTTTGLIITSQAGEQIEVTLLPTSEVQQAIDMLPPPGTAQVVVTQEANAASVPFFIISYEETGGPANTSLTLEIFNSGRVIRDGAELTVPQSTIDELNQMIQELSFMDIQGQFTLPGGGPSDVYSYTVRVELEDGSARRLEAHDRATPPELRRFFSTLRNVGI
ncbi:MAG: hypothetical protein CL610_01630 [Anaerolineaceae bacterium]|nr:hypothetical protein [Anaerolineaceae bacterium]